jgi:TolB protein
MSSRDGRNNIFLMEADGSNVRRLTNDPWNSASPSWSPRANAIVYVYATQESTQLRIIDVATKEVRALTPALSVLTGSTLFPAWSPDGQYIAYAVRDIALGESDIDVMTVDGNERWRVTEGVHARTLYPAWTPAGDISFSLGDGKQSDIAVTGLRGGGVQLLTDSTTVKESLAWYNPRFFAVQALSILQPQVWGWLKAR